LRTARWRISCISLTKCGIGSSVGRE